MKQFLNFRLSVGEAIVLLLITILITISICQTFDIRPSHRDVAVVDAPPLRDTVYVPKGIYVVTNIKYRDRPQRTTTSTMGNKDANSPSILHITPIIDTILQGTIETYIRKDSYEIVQQNLCYTFRKASKDSADVNEDTPKKPPSGVLVLDTLNINY